jgi:hypothetical protein
MILELGLPEPGEGMPHLNPRFAEALMGWPPGSSEPEVSEVDSYSEMEWFRSQRQLLGLNSQGDTSKSDASSVSKVSPAPSNRARILGHLYRRGPSSMEDLRLATDYKKGGGLWAALKQLSKEGLIEQLTSRKWAVTAAMCATARAECAA